MKKPSKVTKVLIKKIHGGRKQDSKFWKSEFDKYNVKNENKDLHNVTNKIESYAFFILSLLALSIISYGGYYIYKQYFGNNALFTTEERTKPKPKIKYSKPIAYSVKDNNKENTITQKELNKAINKALDKRLRQRERIKKRNERLDYYEVTLANGNKIKAIKATRNGDMFTIEDTTGLIYSLDRAEIETVRKQRR